MDNTAIGIGIGLAVLYMIGRNRNKNGNGSGNGNGTTAGNVPGRANIGPTMPSQDLSSPDPVSVATMSVLASDE